VPNGPLATPLAPHASWLLIGSLKITVSVSCVADALTTYGRAVSGVAGGIAVGSWMCVGVGVGVPLGATEGVGGGVFVRDALWLGGGGVSAGVGAAVRLDVGTGVGRPSVPL